MSFHSTSKSPAKVQPTCPDDVVSGVHFQKPDCDRGAFQAPEGWLAEVAQQLSAATTDASS